MRQHMSVGPFSTWDDQSAHGNSLLADVAGCAQMSFII